MQLTYPLAFEQLLARDRPLRVAVDALAVLFDGWLGTSRIPFFTDYTDHGIDHLNQVLGTAAQLIASSARAAFTPGDAAVLTAATLFHDAALHLSEAGFYDLIRGQASGWVIEEFSDRSWPVLWDEFLFSAKRWDERRLREVLGETPDGAPLALVRDPFTDYDNLTDSDRRLIGEFIRQHHPRMAHEFAVNGVPGRTLITVGHAFGDDLRDLAGLIARSHGLLVRRCVSYLQSKYHRREYKGIHAVFLMTLLRVADYLQIEAARAPAIVFQYRHIPSKKSALEWMAHNAIRNITRTHDDPESIEVQAAPTDVHTYLRLKEWLAGIQDELDTSWAVLGETYGLHPELRKLGLILRRVRSNLDDPTDFARTVSYVPERIELAVARPDLLKLLVRPLYDNVPSIGIRELMQNAVDAVREREVLQERHHELQSAPLIEQAHDVELRVSMPDAKGVSWLVVRDRGVGMTVATVRDYFLTAGASFRNSDAWKREFEMDDAPRSRVLRSGRFGIGVLAGFLLGPRMEVATRHIRSDIGIRFTTTMDLEAIELREDPTLRVGTEVRIAITAAVRQQLMESGPRVAVPEMFDWFVYNHPTIGRSADGQSDEPRRRRSRRRGRRRSKAVSNTRVEPDPFQQEYAVPRPSPDVPSAFRLIRGEYGYSAYWTYRPMPRLTVNGIFITDSATRARFSADVSRRTAATKDGVPFELEHPNVCVEDPDGSFPLNLRRSGITGDKYPFDQQLVTDIIDDYLAFILVRCPAGPSGEWEWIDKHPGVRIKRTFDSALFQFEIMPLFFTTLGVGILSPRAACASQANVMYFSLPSPRHGLGFLDVLPADGIAAAAESYSRSAYGLRNPVLTDISYLAAMDVTAARRQKTANFRASKQELKDFLVPASAAGLRGVRIVCPTTVTDRFTDPATFLAKALTDYGKWEYGHSEFDVEAHIRDICSRFSVDRAHKPHVTLATSGCPQTRLRSDRLTRLAAGQAQCLVELHLAKADSAQLGSDLDIITRRWNEVIRQPIIPFDPADRKRGLAHAYEALAPFIRAHEAMKEVGVFY